MSLGKGLESLIPAGSGGDDQGLPPPHDDPEPLPAVVSATHGPVFLHVEESVAPVMPAPTTPSLTAFAPTPSISHQDSVVSQSGASEEVVEDQSAPARNNRPEKEQWMREAEQHSATGDAVFYLEVAKIHPNPHQPRRYFDEAAINDLATSIREFGIIQPLVVTKITHDTPHGTEVEYELIAGERRLLASKKLGLETVPAIVRNVDFDRERLELAVIENLQRENLNAIEMARAFARLQDEFRMTQREIASRLGKSRETVANTMRLLDLPSPIQQALEKGEISESHGRLLLALDDPAAQERLFRDLISTRMTTRELKHRVEGMRTREKRVRTELSPELQMARERLAQGLGAPVDIQEQDGGSGKITISFFSEEELRGILDRISRGE